MEGSAGLPGKDTEYAPERVPLVRDWQERFGLFHTLSGRKGWSYDQILKYRLTVSFHWSKCPRLAPRYSGGCAFAQNASALCPSQMQSSVQEYLSS